MLGRVGVRVSVLVSGLGVIVLAGLTACGSSGGGAAASGSADRTFLQEMITHHERAIAVARIAQTSATDPRVRTFAARVVREQSPELAALQKAAAGMSLNYSAGATSAMHRITDAQVTALKALRGTAFDRQWVQLNVTSEQGAYTMARTELRDGKDGAARTVATGISHSPSEIAELKTLLLALR